MSNEPHVPQSVVPKYGERERPAFAAVLRPVSEALRALGAVHVQTIRYAGTVTKVEIQALLARHAVTLQTRLPAVAITDALTLRSLKYANAESAV